MGPYKSIHFMKEDDFRLGYGKNISIMRSHPVCWPVVTEDSKCTGRQYSVIAPWSNKSHAWS